MRFKLDENLDPGLLSLVAGAADEADTILSEGLSGKEDVEVYGACRAGGRILVTLDLDFSNPFRFPPEATEGIIVLRPVRPSLPRIRALLAEALPELKSRPLRGALWIVEPGRIRVHDPIGREPAP